MDDLISRKAAIETVKKLLYETALNSCGHHQDDEIYADIAENRIEVWLGLVPSIPAAPLDKLCEWLANSFSDPPCCALEKVRCEMECRGFTQINYSECWRHVLTKWMEGLDGTD